MQRFGSFGPAVLWVQGSALGVFEFSGLGFGVPGSLFLTGDHRVRVQGFGSGLGCLRPQGHGHAGFGSAAAVAHSQLQGGAQNMLNP